MPEQKVVYVAGPFRADSAWKIEQNIRRAEDASLELWLAGYAVLCPHANSRHFHGEFPDEVVLAGDITLLLRCDIIYMLCGWEESSGSRNELKAAQAAGLLVMYQQYQQGGD